MSERSRFLRNAPEANPLESKEAEPKFSFRVLYSAHDLVKDFWTQSELEAELAKTDIWFPEMLGWTEDTEEKFNLYATGKYIPQANEPVMKVELEALTNTGRSGKVVKVGFVDFPEHHPLLKKWRGNFNYWQEAILEFRNGNFDKAVRELKAAGSKHASFERVREKYMHEHIQEKVDAIVRNDARLQEKIQKGEKLNILVTLGTFHVGFFHGLDKEGKDVEQKVNGLPLSEVGPFHELALRYRLKEDVDDALAARALLFVELLPEIGLIDESLEKLKVYQVVNKLVASVPLKDIKNISLELKAGRSIDEILRALNIRLPHSEKEMDIFLQT